MRTSRIRPVAIVELDDNARRVLGRRHPHIAGYASALVVVTDEDLKREVSDTLYQLAEAANGRRKKRLERLIEELIESGEAESPLLSEEAARQARFRFRMLRDHPAHTATQLGRLRGSTAADPTQIVNRWRVQGRVFAVQHQGTKLYFGFQFDREFKPLSIIAKVLEQLRGWEGWDIAAWFVTPNGMLDKLQPLEVLGDGGVDLAAVAALDARIRRPS